jgi:hypothetical protein
VTAAAKRDGEAGDGVNERRNVSLGDDHDAEVPGERLDPNGMSAPWQSSGRRRRRRSAKQQRRATRGCRCKAGIFSAIITAEKRRCVIKGCEIKPTDRWPWHRKIKR